MTNMAKFGEYELADVTKEGLQTDDDDTKKVSHGSSGRAPCIGPCGSWLIRQEARHRAMWVMM